MTYNQFIDGVAVAMGYTHDDALYNREYILACTIYAENKLVGQDLSRDLGKASDGVAAQDKLVTRTVDVTYNATPDDAEWAYHYFELPEQVFDLSHGAGISFVRYHQPSLPVACPPSVAKATFSQTSIAALSALYATSYQDPRPSRPYFARSRDGQGGRVRIFGIDPEISKLIVGLHVAADFATIDPATEMNIGPARLHVLMEMVMEMLTWALQIPQERLKNDGADFGPDQAFQTRPLISANDPANLESPPEQ